jgi:putative ABC transport system permease protein
LRTDGDPARLAGPLRTAVRGIDPNVPVAAVRPMTAVVAGALATPRLAGAVLAVFAALALVLSAVGLFGVLNYLVSQRRVEIGLRLALGADPGHILRQVLGSGLRLSLVGGLLGTVGAFALARLLGSLLHGVRAHDPVTFTVVPATLLLVAMLAGLIPAWRATRVDPSATLRAE